MNGTLPSALPLALPSSSPNLPLIEASIILRPRVLSGGQNQAQLQGTLERLSDLVPLPQPAAYHVFTPILPRFHLDGTYQPFLPHFYPGFTPF